MEIAIIIYLPDWNTQGCARRAGKTMLMKSPLLMVERASKEQSSSKKHHCSISLVVAFTENYVIGKDNDMPWYLPNDLKYFKKLTLAKPVIMGRKTWQSLGCRSLPGRLNIVVTRNESFKAEGAVVVCSPDEACKVARKEAKKNNIDEIFIIGGGEIFKQALPFAGKMYVTEILAAVDGDTFFPAFDREEWHTVSSKMVPAGKKDSHSTRYVIYERTTTPGAC